MDPPPDEVLTRVSAVDELVPADLLVEAVVEDVAREDEEIFSEPPTTSCPQGPLLASNTSSISITALASTTEPAGPC